MMQAAGMNDITRSALNRRNNGDDVCDWEYDSNSQLWRVVCEDTATAVVPGAQATANLLATAHIGAITDRQKASQDERTSRMVGSVVEDVLDALHDQIWKAISKMASIPSTAYQQTLLHEPRTEATRRLAREAARTTNNMVARDLLSKYADKSLTTLSRQATYEWLPLVRLAHTEVAVDPDNIPRFERDLHHTDEAGKLDELYNVLALTVAALTSEEAATMWEKLVKFEDTRSVSSDFAEMASSTRPFGWPSTGTEALYAEARAIADELAKQPCVVAVGVPNAECDFKAPVVDFNGSHNEPTFAIGTAAYPFVEGIVLAAQCLTHANAIILPPNHPVKRVRVARAGRLAYGCTWDSVKKYLKENFSGWHHSRCLEPRQTAHATVAGKEAVRVKKHLTALDSCSEKELPRLYSLFQMIKDADHPRLVRPPTFFCKGPGHGAVATVCEAIEYLCPTDHLKRLERELWGQLTCASRDIPKLRPDNCVAVKLGFPPPGPGSSQNLPTMVNLSDLAEKYVENIEALACAVLELHTYDTIRADAGKRYRHTLGAHASAAALDTALRQLLLSPAKAN